MTHRSQSGTNFAEGHAANGTELLWGDPPATMIEEGIQCLIARLYRELHRHPTVAEIDERIYCPTPAPEIIEAMANAARVFREDIGRDPTPAELQAWLLTDTQGALFKYLELEIQIGTRVMWAEHDDDGQLLHQTIDGRDDMVVLACGTVASQPQGWHRDNTITRDDGQPITVGRKWLIKVLD